MLEVRDLHAYYGKSHILQGVDMHIDAGEVVSLLGRNGVGRSTTVKAIMGEVPPQGSILFKGSNIAGLPSYRIAHLGLGYVPEHRDIFPGLTVRQNLMLGIKDPRKPGKWRLEDMLQMFPNLAARADTAAGVMSGGEKQMLKNSRDLFGEFKVHRVGRRTPQGHEGYRTMAHNINHARRHFALPSWAHSGHRGWRYCGKRAAPARAWPVIDAYSAACRFSPRGARPRAACIDW